MTRDEFLKKFPKPWHFEETDPSGTGVIFDANEYPIVILWADLDFDSGIEGSAGDEPAFQIDEEHAAALVAILTGDDE